MVKKSRNLVRLATLSAAVCAALTLSGCHLDTSGARQNGEELSDATPYNIATDVPSDVTVDVASSALPGEIVDVELTYDAAKVQIDALLVNGSRAASIDADSFYFEMPGEDVVLTLDAVIQGDYRLVNLDAETELYGYDALGFDAGEEVSFSLGLPPGSPYTITGVEVGILNEEGTAIETPLDVEYAADVYTFQAPEDLARDIGVLAEKEVKLFSITTERTNVSAIYETIDGEQVDITSRLHAYYGHTVTVELKDTDALLATGIHIVETDQTIVAEDVEGTKTCTFTMPAQDITLEAVTEENRIPLTIEQGSHVTIIPSLLDEETGALAPIEDQKAVPGQRVYLDYESDDPDYRPYQFFVRYTSLYGSEITATVREDEYGHYFTMVNCASMTISVEEASRQTIQLVDSANLHLSLWSLVEGEYVALENGVFPDEEVYVHVEDTSAAGIALGALSIDFVNAQGEADYIQDVNEEGDGYYSFIVENGTDYVITVLEDDATRFEGESFVGEYVYANIMDSSWANNRELTLSFSIDSNGQSSKGDWIVRIEENDDGTGTIYWTDGKVGVYGDGFYFSSYYDNLTNDDTNVYAKVDGTELHARCLYSDDMDQDDNADVGFYEIYSVVDGAEQSKARFVIFFDEENPEQVLSGVEYVLEGGTTILDATTVTATVDGVALGSIVGGVYAPAA